MSSGRRLFVIAVIGGALVRIVQTATSLGSLDALMWYRWVELIERTGILRSYLYSELMNHPPLALLVARVTNRIGVAFGLEFHDSFRYLQLAADVVTALLLVRIARRLALPDRYAPALMFFLSPAVIFISAFHCNSDPLMSMLLVAAIAAVIEQKPVSAGVLLASAVGIKILPLLAGPLLLLALRGARARWMFLAAAAATALAIFLPGFVVSGPLFVRQVFFYTGMTTGWGVRLVANLAGEPALIALSRGVTALLLVALAALWVAEWRRAGVIDARRLPALAGITFLVTLFFAPGFGVQYLFWVLPYLAFTLPRRVALALHGLVSVFVFFVYTGWADGWPWWFADGSSTREAAQRAAYTGLVVWVAIGIALVLALRATARRA